MNRIQFHNFCWTLSEQFSTSCQQLSGRVVKTASICPEEHFEEKDNFENFQTSSNRFWTSDEKGFTLGNKSSGRFVKTAFHVSRKTICGKMIFFEKKE